MKNIIVCTQRNHMGAGKIKFKMEIIKFTCECKIKFTKGKLKRYSIELPAMKVVDKSWIKLNEITKKDKTGNTFTYSTIIYKDKEYIPIIKFKLSTIEPERFSDHLELAYFHLYDGLNDILIIDEVKHDLREFYKREKFEEYLTPVLSDYLKMYDKIYLTNYQKIVDITPKEIKYIELFVRPAKITRFTAFLVLLLRFKDHKVFKQYDLSKKQNIEDLYQRFFALYKKRPKNK